MCYGGFGEEVMRGKAIRCIGLAMYNQRMRCESGNLNRSVHVN